jgi:hypothetical protein
MGLQTWAYKVGLLQSPSLIFDTYGVGGDKARFGRC